MGLRAEAGVFLLVAFLIAATDVGYWFFSYDTTGTVALGVLFGMAFLIGFYLWSTGSRIGRRPEDDPEGDIAEGAGEYGFYSPYSWWPLWLAMSAALTGIGIAVAWWLALMGIFAVIMAAVGMVFEYYRGVHVH